MRQIKFRAWDSLERKMIYFELKDYATITSLIAYTGDFYLKLKLMQFTGLHDKNGKEIWEGDVIAQTVSADKKPVEVFMDEYKWNARPFPEYLQEAGESFFDYAGAKNSEVLGNIYENPELLK